MRDTYHASPHEHKGHKFLVTLENDYDRAAPHIGHYGHGVVEILDGSPSGYITQLLDDDDDEPASDDSMEAVARYRMMEVIDRPGGRRSGGAYVCYDVLCTLPIAKRDGWGPPDGFDEDYMRRFPDATPEKLADARVMAAVYADIAYLRGWYAGDWWWTTVIVTLIDDEGDEVDYSAICGFDSWDDEGISNAITELCDELIDNFNRK